jgi:hypothetical protein
VNALRSTVLKDKRFCLCGCGAIVTGITTKLKIKEYIQGHNRKGKKHPNYIPKLGEQHGKWKGGKIIDSHGYVQIRVMNHPRAYKHGHYVLEHDLVMEKHLGRYLRSNENVHHKNGNRHDNRIENLQLMDRSEHLRMHHRLWLNARAS